MISFQEALWKPLPVEWVIVSQPQNFQSICPSEHSALDFVRFHAVIMDLFSHFSTASRNMVQATYLIFQ